MWAAVQQRGHAQQFRVYLHEAATGTDSQPTPDSHSAMQAGRMRTWWTARRACVSSFARSAPTATPDTRLRGRGGVLPESTSPLTRFNGEFAASCVPPSHQFQQRGAEHVDVGSAAELAPVRLRRHPLHWPDQRRCRRLQRGRKRQHTRQTQVTHLHNKSQCH